jgi:hypothetical protein
MRFKEYIIEQFEKHPFRNALVTGIIIGGTLLGAIWETVFVSATGYWNPARQTEYLNAKIEKSKQKKIKFNQLYDEFVRFADKDDNGYIDFAEQVDVWKRMGEEGGCGTVNLRPCPK